MDCSIVLMQTRKRLLVRKDIFLNYRSYRQYPSEKRCTKEDILNLFNYKVTIKIIKGKAVHLLLGNSYYWTYKLSKKVPDKTFNRRNCITSIKKIFSRSSNLRNWFMLIRVHFYSYPAWIWFVWFWLGKKYVLQSHPAEVSRSKSFGRHLPTDPGRDTFKNGIWSTPWNLQCHLIIY